MAAENNLQRPATHLPLAGLRVLDLTMFWAGPHCTMLLGDMGAEIVKVESLRHFCSTRVRDIYPGGDPGDQPWERSGLFIERNRSKLGITLDLTTGEGIEVLKHLARLSDVLIENFSYGMLQRFGLDYDTLQRIHPELIVVSMPSLGNSGPERDFSSGGGAIEQLAGIASLNGYPGDPPRNSAIVYPDVIAGIHAVGAVLTALRTRRKTGKGLFIDLSHLESAIPFIADAVMDYAMNRRIQGPRGNRDPRMAPHGCFRCKGEDEWVAIAVKDNTEWRSLCELIGRPDLSTDPRFRDGPGRYQNYEALDPEIEAWTSTHDHRTAMHLLQEAGIAAGAVLSNKDLLEDPHLRERDFFQMVSHPVAGAHPLLGLSWNLSKTPGSVRLPAPCLGQHNHHVYQEILGLPTERIEALEAQGVVGTVPYESYVSRLAQGAGIPVPALVQRGR